MIDLSNSTDPEIVAAAHLLAELDAAARGVGVPYMVVGATARNIISVALFDRLPGRATRDVDIAVAVGSWEEFRSLTAGMDGRGSEHAYLVGGVDVDIVPYGAIEAEDRTVLLPNDHRMNMLGFREAFISAEVARLPGGLDVRVPTPAGLAVLKVVAWGDRHLRTRHDAVDLAETLVCSHEGPLLESLYETETELLTLYDFDPARAGAHRFGRDAGLLGLRKP